MKSSMANSLLELFAFNQKENWVFFLTFSFHWLLLSLLKRGSPCNFAPRTCQKRGIKQRVPLCALSCWCPCVADGRWYWQSSDYYVTPKFLGLIGYQICLGMVLSRCASCVGCAIKTLCPSPGCIAPMFTNLQSENIREFNGVRGSH